MTEPINLERIARSAMKDFKGQCPSLEGAIGCMYVTEQFGWKTIYLVHDKKTIKKYEKILGINFRESFDEVGPLSHKSLAYKASLKITNFWKAVKGEIPGVRTPNIE